MPKIPDELLNDLKNPIVADWLIPVGQVGKEIDWAIKEAYIKGYEEACEIVKRLLSGGSNAR